MTAGTYPELRRVCVIRYGNVDLNVVGSAASFELRLDLDHILHSAALMMLNLVVISPFVRNVV